ncbi:non-ribosomal peptide synthetase [Streptomyces sp. NPDC059010]|uniref:non-ribosomal peptide synthetase n=1 Tax=Streptomyces sp. NPDC059010 TaxID=3346695 RepID=UPI00369E708E
MTSDHASDLPGNHWSPRGITTLIHERVAAHPDAPAVCDTAGEALSYAELWERSGWLAADLAGRGIGTGDRVALALGRSVDFVVAVLGVIRAGAAYIPLDPMAPPERVDGILADAEPAVILAAPNPRPALPPTRTPVVTGLPDRDPGTPVPDPAPDPESVFYIGFTSGSTGRPKGVMIPHRAVERFATAPNYVRFEPGLRVACLGNPAFDIILFEVWTTLAGGGTAVVLPDAVDIPIADWAAVLAGERIDTLFLTTALLEMIVLENPRAFASARSVIFGGDVVDPGALRAICATEPPRELVHVYGPTETATFASSHVCRGEELRDARRVPIGKAVQSTTLSLRDADLRPVPSGEIGEICIGGPQVALGYLGLPELTAERFVVLPDGERLYRTGDLGRLLPDGTYAFQGRVDRQVKVRGFRVELGEVEAAALRTGLVAAVVVERVGEGPEAHLVGFAAPTAEADPTDLVAGLTKALRQTLPEYMVPHRWRLLPTLPINSNGKVDRTGLLAGLAESAIATAADVADGASSGAAPGDAVADVATDLAEPESELCALLCEVVAGVLHLPQVKPEDNFLDLGGTSILALQAASRLRKALTSDVLLNPAEILFADSLRDLSRSLLDPTDAAR